MRVLVVDDSVLFRSQIKEILSAVSGIEVVGSAPDGKIALEKMQSIDVDLVTLDLEMPKLNGIDTIREIKKMGHRARIIVFAAESSTGASLALEALRAGADDFVAKPKGNSLEDSRNKITIELVPRVLQFDVKDKSVKTLSSEMPWEPDVVIRPPVGKKLKTATLTPEVVVLGSSTGGPNALENIFKDLRPPIFRPIIIVQHMPPLFTEILAKRIQSISGISCLEVKQWTLLENDKIYVAPGDYHISLFKKPNENKEEIFLRLDQGPLRHNVRPAVDNLFESAASLFGKRTLGIVLTGMGEDGLQGAKSIKDAGGAVLIQDKESSVVFGMPGAVFAAGVYDEIMPLEMIANVLKCTTQTNYQGQL